MFDSPVCDIMVWLPTFINEDLIVWIIYLIVAMLHPPVYLVNIFIKSK